VLPEVVSLHGEEEADDALLAEILTLDAGAGGEATGDTIDGGHEEVDQLAACIRVTAFRRCNKSPFLPRAEPSGVAHRI
jgi:hypothetical protein